MFAPGASCPEGVSYRSAVYAMSHVSRARGILLARAGVVVAGIVVSSCADVDDAEAEEMSGVLVASAVVVPTAIEVVIVLVASAVVSLVVASVPMFVESISIVEEESEVEIVDVATASVLVATV